MKLSPLHPLWIILLFAGIGAFDYHFRSETYLEREISGHPISFTGEIKEVKYLANGDRFLIHVQTLRDSLNEEINCRNLNILLKTDGYSGSKGDILSFETTPEKFGSHNSTSDYENKMRHQGISYTAKSQSSHIRKIGSSHSVSLYFNDLRDRMEILVENSSLSLPTGNFLISILLGDKTFLPSETRKTLNSAGLAHILALSGMHVAIILSIILVLLFPLSLLGFNKTGKIIALILIWLYVLFTGGSPSTIRATIMATFMVLALILERKNSALNALLAAVLIIILVDPLTVWDIGLQLSFLCVASIILFTNRLNPVEKHFHPMLHKIVNLVLVTLISTFCTWIVVAYYFYSIPLLFLPANIVLLPLLPLFIACGSFYFLMLCLGFDLNFVSKGLEWFHDTFINLADYLSFSGSSDINLEIPPLSVFLWIIGIIAISILFYSSNRRKKRYMLLLASISLISSVMILLYPEKTSSSFLKFPHSFTKLEASIINSKSKSNLEFPRNSISKAVTEGIEILAIDAPVVPEHMASLKESSGNQKRYLMIGTGSQPDQIAELINQSDFSGIILHSGIGKNKKMELLHLLDISEWDKIYSLRENGSFEFDL